MSPASGRRARSRRKEVRRQNERLEDATVDVTPLPDRKPPRPKRKSLRERRAERRRLRLRQEGRDPDRPESRVRPMGVVWVSWRWLSAALTIMLSIVLYVLLATDLFIVDSMAVGGERYLTREQIFQASGLANIHLFWVDPDAVEAKLEENPSIADAEVYIGWPPDLVSIVINERNPVLIWEQGNFRVWVDAGGTVMFQRDERDDLLRIIYADDEPLGVGSKIDTDVVAGALLLRDMYPNIDVLNYDDLKGLGYRDGRGWTVWFGTGTNMEMKAKVYDKIVSTNLDTLFRQVDVSDPDHPWFDVRFPE